MSLTDDTSKGVAGILFGELGLTEKRLLKTVADSLKATRLYGPDLIKHPDYTERRKAALDLLALVDIIVPTKSEVFGSMDHRVMTDDEVKRRLEKIRAEKVGK